MKAVLVIVAVGLGLLLHQLWGGWAVRAPVIAPPDPAKALDAQPQQDASGGFSIPLQAAVEYAGIDARPLFSPTRRPPDVEQTEIPAAVVAKPLKGLDLVAIMITPSESVALVRDAASGENTRLKPGDKIRGWTVKAVEKDGLKLASGAEKGLLELREFPDHAAPPPRTRPQVKPRPGRPVKPRRPRVRPQRGPDSDED